MEEVGDSCGNDVEDDYSEDDPRAIEKLMREIENGERVIA